MKALLSDSDLPSDTLITRVYRQYNDSIRHIKIEKGLYQKGVNVTVDRLAFQVELPDTTAAEWPVSELCGKVLNRPETYEDVKGLVISDYQNYLEQKWVRKLRKKYPVSVQKEVLATVKPVEE